MDLVLKFEVPRVFEVRREASDWCLHAWFDTKFPLFRALKLDREVFLEVHMPICIVALSTHKCLDFPSGVTEGVFCLAPWEVA